MHEDQPVAQPDPAEFVVPLHAETLEVARLARETGRVRVSTVTQVHERIVDEMLAEEHAHVKRVAIGRVVEAVPGVRQEGDTTVIPVVEEVLVVERRLFLKQEIHVTRVRTMSRHQETVPLREQEAIVTRVAATRTAGDAVTDEDQATSNIDGEYDGK